MPVDPTELATLVAALLESPWEASDTIPPLADEMKLALRAAMLRSLVDNLTADAVSVLGWFPDDEVVAALEGVLGDPAARTLILEAVPEALAKIGTPRAMARVVNLVDHPVAGVARKAIENLAGARDACVELLLGRFDALVAHGDNLLVSSTVEKLVELDATSPAVIATLARHWDFSVRLGKTLMGSNAIFDALIEHAPTSPVAQAAFIAAAAHDDEYAKVRGHAALAITGGPLDVHFTALTALSAKAISTKSLRTSGVKAIVTARRAELEVLAAAGNKAAVKALR